MLRKTLSFLTIALVALILRPKIEFGTASLDEKVFSGDVDQRFSSPRHPVSIEARSCMTED